MPGASTGRPLFFAQTDAMGSRLERAVGTRGAIAINVITMIGIGPLITIPLVLVHLAGPLALVGWVGGALVALCDGLVWSELATRYPGSGGTYVYLREIFGRERWGRLFAFLYNWQFFLAASLVISTGYIGFANYAGYIFPRIAHSSDLRHDVAVCVGLVTVALLYRRVSSAAGFGIALAFVAIGTLVIVGIAGFTHADFHRAFTTATPIRASWAFLAGFGSALYITLYDYGGYSQAAFLGEEVREPRRTLPISIVASILIVLALYLFLQVGVLGAIPWQTLVGHSGTPPAEAQFVASSVVAHAWGRATAVAVTVLILITAFASVYGGLLGNSRVPFAAARDGEFLPIFARLHPRQQFPHLSLLGMGAIAIVACFFNLDIVIAILSSAGILVGSIGQIIALFVLHARGERTPFRMWLFPLPALVALAGWLLAFWFTGALAIGIGVAWLAAGTIVFMLLARTRRWWPFATAAAVALGVLLPRTAYAAPVGAWRTWHTSHIVQINGYPVFEVDGKPFFVYGASFFYERTPVDLWERSLIQYRNRLGINTIDLYVPWNWQEPSEGRLDFTGRTNPRRNLLRVFELTHKLGFKIILRPGPVIRNEWRNGGYPYWLLERPDYNMPLRDVLEGRYPATATLQNRHADAAAQEWLHNATHVHYAANWLAEVLSVVAPFSHDIIAIALDDDQGAYLDNDTWPAPHWHAYIGWLRRTVEKSTGTRVPLFINTYEMKETADSPAWAWGDWYQSDAYLIGQHDREQIDFSTAMLGMQLHKPILMAEFQAGWLQGADENAPRPTDGSNTGLALHEFLSDGARGIVNFPVQDTLYPAGWEVPWANWAYDWGAAFSFETEDEILEPLQPLDKLLAGAAWSPDLGQNAGRDLLEPLAFDMSDREVSTADFGALVREFGALLAQTHRIEDGAILWPVDVLTSPAASNRALRSVATMLTRCRLLALSCGLVDLQYAKPSDLSRFPALVSPFPITTRLLHHLGAAARREIESLEKRHRLYGSVDSLRYTGVLSGDRRAVFLAGPGLKFGFLDLTNWSDDSFTRRFGPFVVRLAGDVIRIPSVRLFMRSPLLIPVDVPLRTLDPRLPSDEILRFADCDVTLNRFRVGLRLVTSPEQHCDVSLRTRASIFNWSTAPNNHLAILFAPGGAISVSHLANHYFTATSFKHSSDFDFGPGSWPIAKAGPGVAVFHDDPFQDGYGLIVLQNSRVRLAFAPHAGARAALLQGFQLAPTGETGSAELPNAAATIGLLRDAVDPRSTPSPRDYIAIFTHPIPAGTFNRSYACSIDKGSAVACSYTAPDLPDGGAEFSRVLSISPDGNEIRIEERMVPTQPRSAARLVSISGFSVDRGAVLTALPGASCFGIYHPGIQGFFTVTGPSGRHFEKFAGWVARLCWRPEDLASYDVRQTRGAAILTLHFKRNHVEMRLGVFTVNTKAQARALVSGNI
jgi:amino acid transporter